MTVRDFYEKLDGWTSIRIDTYDEDRNDYVPAVEGNPYGFADIDDALMDVEIQSIGLEKDFIVIRVEMDEEE